MDSEYTLEAGVMELAAVLDVREKKKCREIYLLDCSLY